MPIVSIDLSGHVGYCLRRIDLSREKAEGYVRVSFHYSLCSDDVFTEGCSRI